VFRTNSLNSSTEFNFLTKKKITKIKVHSKSQDFKFPGYQDFFWFSMGTKISEIQGFKVYRNQGFEDSKYQSLRISKVP
jgi:hypothetical protein